MAITLKEFIEATKIKLTTKEIYKNTKVKQLIDYINEYDIDIYESDVSINEEAFLELLDNVHSLDVVLKILSRTADLLSINYRAKQIADFYNLYDADKFEGLSYEEAKILLDEEYLKYASKEWTESHLLSYPRIIHVSTKRIVSKANTKSEDDEDYIEPIYINLRALEKAKQNKLLKEAVSRICATC